MKTFIVTAIAALVTVPAFARPGRPVLRPPVIRPLPPVRPIQCDLYTVQTVSQSLVRQSEELTQESLRFLGRSPKTRAAREFTQEARRFDDLAYSAYRGCFELNRELPYLRQSLEQLRQAFDRRRPGHHGPGYGPGYGHFDHHGPRGGRLLQEQFERVERIAQRLITLVGRGPVRPIPGPIPRPIHPRPRPIRH